MKDIDRTSQELLAVANTLKEKILKEEQLKREEEEKKRIANLPENVAKRIFESKILGNSDVFEKKINNMLADLVNLIKAEQYKRKFYQEVCWYLSGEKIVDESKALIIKLVLNKVNEIIPSDLLDILDISVNTEEETIDLNDDPNDFGWGGNYTTYVYLKVKIIIDFNKLIKEE